MDISGASAVVTGGASGIGAAAARALAARGARVVVADLSEDKGKAVADQIGGDFARVDVTRTEDIVAAVDRAEQLGPVRVLVNSAGIGWAQRTVGKDGSYGSAADLEAYRKVIAINLVGTFNVLRLAASAMLANEPDEGGECGVCINTSSIAYADGQIGQIAYAASKGGVASMTLPAARDLASARIRVVTIAPGLFDTPLLAALPEPAREALGAGVPHPARLGDPVEYGALAAHIVENPMLNGEVIRLDGALRMPPR